MPFNIQVTVPRSLEADVTRYRLYRQGPSPAGADTKVADVPQPTTGDPLFSFLIAEPQFSTVLTATAVDAAGNESPRSPGLPLSGDSQAPAAPGPLRLVAMVWVP